MQRYSLLLVFLAWLAPAGLHAQGGATLIADFDPAAGEVPFPINLLFDGSDDGTLNIPIDDPTDPANAPLLALNALDGFSTVAPIVATFSNGAMLTPMGPVAIDSAIDPASVVAGQTVRLFRVQLNDPFTDDGPPFAVDRITVELRPGVDYTVTLAPTDPGGKTLAILPLRPLEPKTSHLVVLTDGIRAAADGSAAVPDQTYILARYLGNHHRPIVDALGRSNFFRLSDAQAQALAQLQPVVRSQEEAAYALGVPRGSIIASWTFTTQSTGDTLAAVNEQVTPRPAELNFTGLTTQAFDPALPGIADIYAGALQVPYYLQAPLSPEQWPVILTTFWRGVEGSLLTRFKPLPVAPQPAIAVPLLATVPNAASGQSRPANGWPVVIFLHGLAQDRTNVLALADTLAAIGFAAIAIDIPLHGITDPANPFYLAELERTFNVDLVGNATGQPGPDGLIDRSGTHFINLRSVLTTRDNLRQAVADLLVLSKTVPTLDLDGDGLGDFDATQRRFVGQSLGGIVGGVFLGVDRTTTAATLANAGGGLARLVVGSAELGPVIKAGLAAAGLVEGTPEFEAFLNAFQQVVDAADPINYAKAAAAAHPVHLLEVVGGGGEPPSLPDQVIPNSVPGAPLSGTEPLARIMGLQSVDMTVVDDQGVRAIARFTEGDHSSFLSPDAAPAVTQEMQSQTAGFMISNGTVLTVTNTTVVQPVPVME